MRSDTMGCDIQWDIIQKFKKLPAFDDWVFLDKEGNEVKGRQLKDAKDGCEIKKILGWSYPTCHCPEHNQRFVLMDEETGESLPWVYYEIKNEDGVVVGGETDDNGFSEKIHAKKVEKIDIIIYSYRCGDAELEHGLNASNGQKPFKKIEDKTTPKNENNPMEIKIKLDRVINFSSGIPDNLGEKGKAKLKRIMKNSGVSIVEITSTARTTRRQAEVMYDNCVRTGADKQNQIYDKTGQKVIAV